MNRIVTKEALKDKLKGYRNIIVSGPQRSGTTFAGYAIADLLEIKYYTEEAFGVHDEGLFSKLLQTRSQKVVQCPTFSHYLDKIEDKENTVIIWMKRPLEEIIRSQRRIGWDHESVEKAKYISRLNELPDLKGKINIEIHQPIAETKVQFWEQYQKKHIPHSTDINYADLSQIFPELWVEAKDRQGFNSRQINLTETKNHISNDLVACQLYLDYGSGFHEEDSCFEFIQLGKNKFSFKLPEQKDKGISALRFDPATLPVIIEFGSIELKPVNSKLVIISDNSTIREKNRFYFNHDDPQLTIQDENQKSIVGDQLILEVNIIRIGPEAVQELYKNRTHQLETEINNNTLNNEKWTDERAHLKELIGVYKTSQEASFTRSEKERTIQSIEQIQAEVNKFRSEFNAQLKSLEEVRNILKIHQDQIKNEFSDITKHINFLSEKYFIKQGQDYKIDVLTRIVFSKYLPLMEGSKETFTARRKEELASFLNSGQILQFPTFEKPVVSFILVLYNRAELTFLCLLSILKYVKIPYEVILVDNISTDETHALLERTRNLITVFNQENVHFLAGCNQACDYAQGEYVLFLNNDTILTEGSISNALSVFDQYGSSVGAVGGKLVLLNGDMQEAGSIMWQQGSCLGYGNGEDPQDAKFMFRRDVDYCSGAYLLTPRKLFFELGKFDELFKPAYYEETDYCVRLHKAGLRVIYEPSVVIRHFEFASSVKSEWAIALQKNNHEKFIGKHKAALSDHFPPDEKYIQLAKYTQFRKKKKILFIDDQIPHVDLGSGFPRANYIVNAAIQYGFHVSVYSLNFPVDENWDLVYRDLHPEVEICDQSERESFAAYLEKNAELFDIIWVSRPHNMEFVKDQIFNIKDQYPDIKVIYDAEAIFSKRDIIRADVLGLDVNKKALKQQFEQEIKLAKNVDRVIAVTENEAKSFSDAGVEKISVIDVAFDINATEADFEERQGLIFVGNLQYEGGPNVDSVRWFLEKVYPNLKKQLGEIPIYIIGNHSGSQVKALETDNISFLGRVDDLKPYFNKVRLALAPTRFSGGSPAKVFQYAAMGVPIIASEIIVKQSGMHSGKEIIEAPISNPKIFSDVLSDYYLDEKKWELIRGSAISYIKTHKTKEAILSELSNALSFGNTPTRRFEHLDEISFAARGLTENIEFALEQTSNSNKSTLHPNIPHSSKDSSQQQYLNTRLSDYLVDALRQETNQKNQKIQVLEQQVLQSNTEIGNIRNSFSFRLGFLLTAPFRFIYELLNGKK